jgi:hypothetical protein
MAAILSLHIVVCRALSRQRLGKQVPVAMHTHATIQVLLEWGFLLVRAKEL